MIKVNPILGLGKYTLMIVENSLTKTKGLGLVSTDRFKTFGNINNRVSITHIDKLDENVDTIIHFHNLAGLEALISELDLLKLSMQLDILKAK